MSQTRQFKSFGVFEIGNRDFGGGKEEIFFLFPPPQPRKQEVDVLQGVPAPRLPALSMDRVDV